MGTQLQSDQLSFVVCGRFDEIDEKKVQPDQETEKIISSLVERLQRKELHPYVDVNFCNCGNAYEHGPSITVLPERVRYLDIDNETIENVIDRHAEDVIREEEG